jgi:dihydrofolate synthase/folylpolyglutamate synthase
LLEKFGIKPGLERIKKVLEILGNPQESFDVIHVAGTNGKGSVCHMLASILTKTGIKTSLFSSPHLVDPRERIKIDGEMISQKECINISEKILKTAEDNKIQITEFEFYTILAFCYFKEKNVKIVVLETGLGGRLDSTNVCREPIVCVITSISFDHTEYLGKTIEEITYEKAGIIKKNCPLVVYPAQEKNVFDILYKKCKEFNCELIMPDKNKIKDNFCELNKNLYNAEKIYQSFEYNGNFLKIPLLGKHQKLNLITVLSVVEILQRKIEINYNSIKTGLEKVSLHARFEILNKNPIVILDGAHNPDGALALSESLSLYFPLKKINAVFGVMKDKDISNILLPLKGCLKKVLTVCPKNSGIYNIKKSNRAMPAEELAKIAQRFSKTAKPSESVESAISEILKETSKDEICLIFGSLYLAKEALEFEFLKNFPSE